MKPYPQFPEDWQDPNQTIYRNFHFNSTPDIEILKDLVKEHISDKGNEGIIRARLLGILNSYWYRANNRFWERHYHPKTYLIRIFWHNLLNQYHRFFKTKKFVREVKMSQLITRIGNDINTNK